MKERRTTNQRIHVELFDSIRDVRLKYGCDSNIEASKMAARILKAREEEMRDLIRFRRRYPLK